MKKKFDKDIKITYICISNLKIWADSSVGRAKD